MSANVHFDARFQLSDAKKLGAEITELSAYINVAMAHFLDLIYEFDEQRYWEQQGFLSCAHWLNFHCGIGFAAGRERLRVARALAALPSMRAAFSDGELSFSKVRAMTRVATPENEDFLWWWRNTVPRTTSSDWSRNIDCGSIPGGRACSQGTRRGSARVDVSQIR